MSFWSYAAAFIGGYVVGKLTTAVRMMFVPIDDYHALRMDIEELREEFRRLSGGDRGE